jgi:hypothetical protein
VHVYRTCSTIIKALAMQRFGPVGLARTCFFRNPIKSFFSRYANCKIHRKINTHPNYPIQISVCSLFKYLSFCTGSINWIPVGLVALNLVKACPFHSKIQIYSFRDQNCAKPIFRDILLLFTACGSGKDYLWCLFLVK